MNKLCAKLAEILDVEEVKETDVLADFDEWDSLTVLSVIAMLDAEYGVNITAMELRNIKTVAELANVRIKK